MNRGISSSCTAGSDGIGGTWYCCQTNYCNSIVSRSNVSLSNSFGLIFTLIIAVYIFKKVQINWKHILINIKRSAFFFSFFSFQIHKEEIQIRRGFSDHGIGSILITIHKIWKRSFIFLRRRFAESVHSMMLDRKIRHFSFKENKTETSVRKSVEKLVSVDHSIYLFVWKRPRRIIMANIKLKEPVGKTLRLQ